MMLSAFLGAIVRRWYIVLVGLVATAGLAYTAMTHSPPTYAARGLVVLLPSEKAVPGGGNPFLDLGGLELPARVVVAYFQSVPAQTAVAEVAPHATVSVTMAEETRGPVIAIDTSASTPQEALDALAFVAGAIPKTLGNLQHQVDAPASSTISSMPLTMDTKALADTSTAKRLIILATGVGLGATAFAAFAIDGLLLRRRGVRAGGPGGSTSEVLPAPTLVRSTSDDESDAEDSDDSDGGHAPARRQKPRRGGSGVEGAKRG